MTADWIRVAVLFGRSIMLARLLPVEIFGVYGLAATVTSLSSMAIDLGMRKAFLHRTSETADEEETAAVYFTLKLILGSAWATIMAVGAFVFVKAQIRTALLVLIVNRVVGYPAGTAGVIVMRRVTYRRLALIRVLVTIFTTLLALGLAWQGIALWALLSADILGTIFAIVGLYVWWKPVWRPRLAWSWETVRYFVRFGSRVLAGDLLSRALDKLDDLWVGLYLGERPLGFYSRALAFARYPGLVFATSINQVTAGTFAELKGNRLSLSRAFFRTNAILVRGGFLLGGLFALVAPEFIRLLIGAKWLPMLSTFRLMLILTLLNPVKGTVANLLVAVGKPREIIQARLVQLAVLVLGLFLLGRRFGNSGVAVAVDGMAVVGMALLYRQALRYVDFSAWRLFAVPSVALVIGLVLACGASMSPGILGSDWRTGFVKAAVFLGVYSIVLASLERREIYNAYSFLRSHLSR